MINDAEAHEAIVPLLQDVVSGFISHPDKLEVKATRVGTIYDIRLHAHVDDYPKIVGKRGMNASALSALFNEIGNRYGINVVISIPDRTERSHPMNRGFTADPNWRREAFMGALVDVLNSICQHKPKIKERVTPSRSGQLADGRTVTMDEESVFVITPHHDDLAVFRREIEIALEVIFRAIGRQQGRRLNLAFNDASEQRTEQRPKETIKNFA